MAAQDRRPILINTKIPQFLQIKDRFFLHVKEVQRIKNYDAKLPYVVGFVYQPYI
jgi:hypothetical protein